MNTDTRFPLWLWLIGWGVTLGAIYSQDLLDGAEALTHIYMIFISLAAWPIFLGLMLGDIVVYLQ